MDKRRSDTRERIRSTAMELFAERGYDKTSLREIAERLGVTKAALYYHFRTKEDIVVSLSEDLRAGIDDLVRWGQSAPPGRARAEQIVIRYGALLHGLGKGMIRFWAENQSAFRALDIGTSLRYQFVALADLMAAPDRAPLTIFYARQALLAISWSLSMMSDLDLDDEESETAAKRIALDIVARM
ncbi:TetR/AcrR family transcriptional regulator [Nocardia amikacinitolerans]|uniref:TetR/AcrR family transcriptional regulator n=1 Tax=Nocardia amikacinitolerans TaxID=756689 RepID=UPI0020A3C563|nr:TetR/AcrR family transcriptional regulator [Nocardia amikacinitolerans]MCP2292565.1 transcriptional regulator, TetR family [Nocardia amikacinitolerans]